jgi:hypothetical protein
MNAFLLTVNYCAVTLVVFLCFRKRQFKLVDPAWAFLGGYFINYCVRPTLFLIDPEMGSAYGGMFNNEVILRGFNGCMLFVMLGLLGFAFGNLAFPVASERLTKMIPSPDLRSVLETRSLRWIALVFLICGWWGLRSFLAQTGWVGSFLLLLQGGERNQFSEATFGNGIFTFAAQLSLVGWALICAYWIVTPVPVSTGRRILRRVIQMAWFVLTLSIWAAFGERSSLLAALFVPLALRYTLFGRTTNKNDLKRMTVPVRKILLSLAAFAFLIGGPIGLIFKGIEASSTAVISMSISAWDSFEFTVLAQNDLRVKDLALGATYLQDIFYSWVPRAIFQSKPERYGIVVIQDRLAPELLANVGATFPPGILVESFANFGYIGLFVIPLLIGIFCQSLYLRFYNNDAYWIVLLSFLFSNLASFRGFGGFIALLMANGLVLCFVIAVCRILESSRASLAQLRPQSSPV